MTTSQDRRRVVVTGRGCLSPVGNTTTETWNNLLAGQSGAGRITRFDASEHKVQIAAELKDFNAAERFGRKEARRMDPTSQYAMAAALEALADSQLEVNDSNRERIGAIIGSGIGGQTAHFDQLSTLVEKGPQRVSPYLIPMLMPNNPGGSLAIELGLQGPNMAIITACATGSNAIGEAAEIIRRGQADVMFAGGTDALILPHILSGFTVMTALSTRNDDPTRASRPFDANRDGFVMGEGAGILVLEALEHAQARGATILAEVTGYGSTNDAYHISAPAENGEGAVKCMTMALTDANLNPQDIGYINAHGTSTPLNDKNETIALKTALGEHAYNIPTSSTKSMTGHLLGAAGGLEAVVSIQSLLEQKLPPTINYDQPDPDCDLDFIPNTARSTENLTHVMSNSFGFGGHNATLIFSKPEVTT